MFRQRDHSPEIMDDTSIEDKRLDQALNELEVINKYLGGSAVTRAGFRKLTDNKQEKLSVLDAGSGGFVIYTAIRSAMLKVYSLDKNKGACTFIRNRGSGETPVCADVKYIPFKHKSFDITHASLLLHHFNDPEIINILRSFIEISRRGIIINDLRRSVLAYIGIKLLTALFSRSEMVKNDGPLSVKKGFTLKELKALMNDLEISDYYLKKKWAFRWLLVIYIR